MEKEFVPYKEAVDLKEMGFDYPCLAQYGDTEKGIGFEIWNDENFSMWENSVGVPLFQQAFRWFREKYPIINFQIETDFDKLLGYNRGYIPYYLGKPIYKDGDCFETYEEAELALLQKLIKELKC